jgi:hypothetical protein
MKNCCRFFARNAAVGYVVRGPTVDGGTRYKPGSSLGRRTGFFIGQKWRYCRAGLREEKKQMLVFKKHKIRKFILIILLFSGSVCQATDNYYVATDGWDFYTPTQAQNPATPWRTLAHALNTITSTDYIVNLATGTYVEPTYWLSASKNGKTIVIKGGSNDANATIFSSTSNTVFSISSLTTGNITWKNMTIKSTYKGSRYLIQASNDYDGVQLTFNNCILGENGETTTGSTRCIRFDPITASPPTRKITLIDSYCYSKDNEPALWVQDIGTLTVSNTLIDATNTSSTTQDAIRVDYELGTVTINNGSIIKSKYNGFRVYTHPSTFAKCEIDDVVFDCNGQAVTIPDYLQEGTFTNITANNGIVLGHVYNYCYHPLGQIIVKDCDLIHTAADANAGVFGLAIGYGVTGAVVSNNNVLDFAIALSLKGAFCNINHNIFRGGNNSATDNHAVYVRSAQNCLFENNTVYALGNAALMLYDQDGFPESNDTDYNVFTNNIFDASGGGKYAIYLRGPEIHHNLFNHNCYVAGSKALGIAGNNYYKTLFGLRMWWATNGGSEESRANESHSIDTNPQFIDAANSDFHLKSRTGRWNPNSQSWVTDAVDSPCIDAGDPNSNWKSELWPHGKRINMGAYEGTPEASMSLSNVGNIADLDNDDYVDYNDMRLFVKKWLYHRVLLPEDLDRNGVVNFTDFAKFAKHWLEGTIP